MGLEAGCVFGEAGCDCAELTSGNAVADGGEGDNAKTFHE
jgi:hypothetical protein